MPGVFQLGSKRYIIAYDLGTTGNKATLYSEECRLEASTFVSYDTYYPATNWAEQDPEDWWKAVCQATRELLEKAGIQASQIAGIVFSGQMMGCVPVTKEAKPLRNAIIWADQRAVREAEQLIRELGQEQVYKITGHRASPSYSAAKIMWLRNNEEEIYKKTYKVLQAKDFIVARLTGQFVTDYSDASGTNLFHLEKLDWSPEIIKASGLDENLLPEARPSTEIVGHITAEIAEEIGLLGGTPVVIGGGDGSCAAAGAGVVMEGTAYNYVGSSSWIGIATKKPIFDPLLRTFNWVHVVPGLYSPTGTMQAAGASYQWLRDQLCKEEVDQGRELGVSPYVLMDQKAEQIAPGSDRLIYLPYLMGERSPRWNPQARATLIGLTIKHTREHIIRAFMEGVSFNLKVILDAFLEQGAKVEAMRLIGGGAKGKVWPQIMADIYEVPVLQATYLDEATSLGAAITGGVGIGLFEDFQVAEKLFDVKERIEPIEEHLEIYRHLYKLFNNAYDGLTNIFAEL